MEEKINILCYGDSNTYGYNPEHGLRYAPSERWTGRLKVILGERFNVIEEGCNGRTTVFDDPVEGWKNGYDYLKACLNSHKPIDLVVMMLGSNDLKRVFNADAKMSAEGAEVLVKEVFDFLKIKQGCSPKVLLIAPPHIEDVVVTGCFSFSFGPDAPEKSLHFANEYRKVAERNGCLFLDSSKYIKASDLDGLHLSREAHAELAERVAEIVMKVF